MPAYMKLPSGCCTFLLFIAIMQILHGTMDTSVDCVLWDQLYCPRGTKPDMLLPICIPNNITWATGAGGGAIVDAPCPSGTQADENGNCRQRLD